MPSSSSSSVACRLDVPLLRTHEVVHLGTLERHRRGEQFSSSLEGHCLSVSHTPHAWQRIAKLGGEPLQVLQRANGCFVDALELLRQPAWTEALGAWAHDQGLVVLERRYRAWDLDLDTNEWTYTTHLTQAEAATVVIDQTGDDQTPGPDGRSSVDPVEDQVPTPLLAQRLGLPETVSLHNVMDALLLAWVEEHVPMADGVWWSETYDPYGYSAPRGGIFPRCLSRWTIRTGDLSSYEDDEHGQRMNVDLHPMSPPSVPTGFKPSSLR